MTAQIGKLLAIAEFRQPVVIGLIGEPGFETGTVTHSMAALRSSDRPLALSSSNNPSALKSPLATPMPMTARVARVRT